MMFCMPDIVNRPAWCRGIADRPAVLGWETMYNSTDWWQTPLGHYLLAREQAFFDQAVADVFGFNAVQIEMPQLDSLRMNRMPKRIRLGRAFGHVRADAAALPLETGSTDLLVLPHVLEFSENPHQVLREAERVLVPEGRLIVSGFNPWSLWGLERRARRIRGGRGYPWCGNFISLPRIKDWLALMNLDIQTGRLGCYVPPSQQPKWLWRLRFMESAGDRWWRVGGGVYFLQAVKRVRGVRMITPAWQSAPAPQRLVVTTDRSALDDRRLPE